MGDTASTAHTIHTAALQMDPSALGAFAYYVESLESLCRINIYFLRQKIDFTNRHEVSCWLTRFKELDLRLIHWKTFLPSKWKDPEVPPEAMIALDPNMTLAHVTHNTSMILLHQRIGYPEPQLKSIKLPNFYSAETCHSAAIEIANIAKKYLAFAPKRMTVSPHFSLCCYIGARVLLVHSQHYKVELNANFSPLVECLDEASRRWLCSNDPKAKTTLSSLLAAHLQILRKRCLANPDFVLTVVGSLESDITWAAGDKVPDHSSRRRGGNTARREQHSNSQTSLSGSVTTTMTNANILSENNAENWMSSSNSADARAFNGSIASPDELTSILETFTDQSFAEMDRVISLDDFNLDTMPGHLMDMSSFPLDEWNLTASTHST